MAERALPTIGVGVRARPAVGTAPRPVAAPRAGVRPAVTRHEVIIGTPARAGMLLGVSAAVYAVTLAGVAGLQSQADAATVAARTPYVDALARTQAANDALEAQVQAANLALTTLANGYSLVGADISAYQAKLDSLVSLVAEVQGSAAALPAHIKLPSVSIRGTVTSRGSSGGGGGGGASTRTSGKTGASGG